MDTKTTMATCCRVCVSDREVILRVEKGKEERMCSGAVTALGI